MKNSLFGHLAQRFSSHPENLATEALSYIINKSIVAKVAFVEFVSQASVELPENLLIRTQVFGEENAIPDLAGIDSKGEKLLLVEAKFWAGLTDNQPLTYLQHLSKKQKSLLLFLAPNARFNTLWPELLNRCREGGVQFTVEKINKDFFLADLNSTNRLGLTSWRALLGFMQNSVEMQGLHEISSDIQQLQGLCERMDSQAFLPIMQEELNGSIGKRIWQFGDLIDDITERLIREKVASTKGMRATAKKQWYGRYMRINNFDCLLKCDFELWSTLRETPLWFRVWHYPEAKEALIPLTLEEPARMIESGQELLIPLLLPVQQERDVVIQTIMEQIYEVVNLLRSQT